MDKRIFRTESQHRFRVSIKRADFEKALAKTVDRYTFRAGGVGYEDLQVPTVGELRQRVQDSYSRRGAVLSDFPLLVWDSQDPQLDACQHRRAAFLELMQAFLQERADITRKNVKVRMPSDAPPPDALPAPLPIHNC